jgi:fructose PTS system EIIBC or EIIC component
MMISELLTEKVINIHLDAKDKDDSINKIINLASNLGTIIDIEKVRKSVFDREKLVSTGVGKGFAIPHGKTDEIKDITAAFAILDKPIDFDSIDMEPVRFIFLLVGKESMLNAHIKLLSRISRLMNKDEFRDRLLKAKSSFDVLNLFREEEKHYFDV